MKVPVEYEGREQTYLKHRVLTEYLNSWAQKLASTARLGYSREVRLWYVDCFAGPWQDKDESLEDTSVAIGLKALERAADTWRDYNVKLSAIFVEKDRKAFARLDDFLSKRPGTVESHRFQGAFGDFVGEIDGLVGKDPAFLFVDPTGWKGAGMNFIAPLASKSRRDVLINVMFNHINRFKDDPREFLRVQMREFFGLQERDIPPGLTEESLFSFYREQLRKASGVPYAADLVIPHATKDRTWFRLVVGGHHHAVVELFRDVEKRICGSEANKVRDDARSRDVAQLGLGFDLEQEDLAYQRLHEADQAHAAEDVLKSLEEYSPQVFVSLWPDILCERHMTKGELAQVILQLVKQRRLVIVEEEVNTRRRTLKDEDCIGLPGSGRS